MKILKMSNRVLSLGFFILFVGLLSCGKSDSEIMEDDSSEQEDKNEEEETEKEDENVLVLNEADFYTPATNNILDKNFVVDYNADVIFETDDSSKLQSAINQISSGGGGTLFIPKGNYTFADIRMKSNVHIVIDEKAVIRPSLREDQRNYSIFSFGFKTSVVENVSITSNTENKFKIDLTQVNNLNATVFNMKNVDGFLLSGFEVDDAFSDFSAVTLAITEYNNEYFWPRNGVVKNAFINNADYGYGLIQTWSATNVYFKDLSGAGGVTLRFETGLVSENNLQIGGVDKLYAENISCKNGNAAVMVSPHAMHNGKIYVNGITSESCGFGIRIDNGYVSTKYNQNIGLTDGTFEEVTLLNVKVTYGHSKAQLKEKHYKYMPCNIRGLVGTTPTNPLQEETKSFWGPSIAGVIDVSNYPLKFIPEDVEAIGFQAGFEVVDDSEAIEDCN